MREAREVEQRRQRQPELGRRFFPLGANFKHAGQRLSRWFILPKRAGNSSALASSGSPSSKEEQGRAWEKSESELDGQRFLFLPLAAHAFQPFRSISLCTLSHACEFPLPLSLSLLLQPTLPAWTAADEKWAGAPPRPRAAPGAPPPRPPLAMPPPPLPVPAVRPRPPRGLRARFLSPPPAPPAPAEGTSTMEANADALGRKIVFLREKSTEDE